MLSLLTVVVSIIAAGCGSQTVVVISSDHQADVPEDGHYNVEFDVQGCDGAEVTLHQHFHGTSATESEGATLDLGKAPHGVVDNVQFTAPNVGHGDEASTYSIEPTTCGPWKITLTEVRSGF